MLEKTRKFRDAIKNIDFTLIALTVLTAVFMYHIIGFSVDTRTGQSAERCEKLVCSRSCQFSAGRAGQNRICDNVFQAFE